MTPARRATNSWASFIGDFHAERPGITERILSRCQAGGIDPYRWCAEPLADHRGPVLDLACGSGPMADHLSTWIGVDTSTKELQAAVDNGRTVAVRASAATLPIRPASVGAATCSMGMQLIEPLPTALGALSAALAPGGRAVLLVPATRPMPWRDAWRYLRLQLSLRRRITYPNDRALRPRSLRRLAASVGFSCTEDRCVAFALPMRGEADAHELVASLYLRDVGDRRIEAGRRVLARHTRGTITVPLRRIVLDRNETDR